MTAHWTGAAPERAINPPDEYPAPPERAQCLAAHELGGQCGELAEAGSDLCMWCGIHAAAVFVEAA